MAVLGLRRRIADLTPAAHPLALIQGVNTWGHGCMGNGCMGQGGAEINCPRAEKAVSCEVLIT